jgi:hypothetical protein
VGSYARRLAQANHLPFGEFLVHLAVTQRPQHPVLIRTHELHLNRAAADRLALFSGLTAATLGRALPGLNPSSAGDRPRRIWTFLGDRNRPVKACSRCAARAGGGEILLHLPLQQTICPAHRWWLAGHDSNRDVDLALLPEVARAARRHARLTRRRTPAVLDDGYRQANQIAQAWFDRASFLTPIWHERYDRLGATHAYGARVITYPETVGLASLLSSLHWTSLLQRRNYHIGLPAFLREAGRRIGHPYPESPRNDPLRYWAARHWAGTPTQDPPHIDW